MTVSNDDCVKKSYCKEIYITKGILWKEIDVQKMKRCLKSYKLQIVYNRISDTLERCFIIFYLNTCSIIFNGKFWKICSIFALCLEFSEYLLHVFMLCMADPSHLLGQKHSQNAFIRAMRGYLYCFLGMKLSLSMHASARETMESELLVTTGAQYSAMIGFWN